MSARPDLAGDLFATVGRFRRQLRRAAGPGFADAGLTEAQAEMLRLVGRRPGISVNEAAAALGLAANTASTLVSKLATAGLILRETDSADRRIGRLRLSDSAQRIADASRQSRRSALREVIQALSADEIRDLTSGLEVISTMTRLLDEQQSRP